MHHDIEPKTAFRIADSYVLVEETRRLIARSQSELFNLRASIEDTRRCASAWGKAFAAVDRSPDALPTPKPRGA